MSQLDLSRFKGIAFTLAILTLALLLIDRTGAATLGKRPARLMPKMHVDWGRFDTFAGRVAAVKQQQARAPERFPARWGIVLGHSSAEQDVDPVTLKEGSGGIAWLVLAGSGGSSGIENLEFHVAILEETGLRPQVLVLALHPFMFAVAPEEAPPKVDFARALRSRSRKDLIDAARLASWLGSTQLLFGEFVRQNARAARNSIATFAGWPEWANYRAAPAPWQSNFKNTTGQMSADSLRRRVERSGELGRFKPESYTEEPVRAAEKLHARIERLGIRAVVVSMPEHSTFRTRIPQIASERLRAGFPARVVKLDLRSTMPDDSFWDPYHLNRDGKRQFSEILGKKLAVLASSSAASSPGP